MGSSLLIALSGNQPSFHPHPTILILSLKHVKKKKVFFLYEVFDELIKICDYVIQMSETLSEACI